MSGPGAKNVEGSAGVQSPSMEPLLLEQVDPRARGQAHGEHWRVDIEQLAERCLGRAIERSAGLGRDEILEAARADHRRLEAKWPAHAQELLGIAQGAGVSLAHIVVINTVDQSLGPQVRRMADEGSTVYFNGERGPLLGLTWDLPADVEPHVRMLRIAPAGSEREVLCLTVTGCPGVAGINERGLAVATTALSLTESAAGVPWPSVVRAVLEQPDAAAAKHVIFDAQLGAGRFFMLADGHDYYGIEHSGAKPVLTQLGPRAAHLHTNHPFDPVLRGRERLLAASTSHHRLNLVTTLYAQRRPRDAEGLWSLLHGRDGSSGNVSVDPPPDDPAGMATCATMIMQLHDGWVRAVRGAEHRHSPVERIVGRFKEARVLPADV